MQLDIAGQEWNSEPLKQVMEVLSAMAVDAGFDQGALIVGGAVRNSILKKNVHDIDIATIFPPSEVLHMLGERGIRALPTGIDHGTVTAVIRKHKFELTTLRKDVDTDGRHAEVEYTRSWSEDARRRDFTMNALYMDLDGNVYDPLGQGVEDTKAGLVRFVGDADTRIKEDYLRVLRFFRFWGSYGSGEISDEGLSACLANLGGLEKLSKERIASEFVKILLSDRADEVLTLMSKHKILPGYWDKESMDVECFRRLAEVQKHFDDVDVTARLYVIGRCDPQLIADYPALLFLTKEQKRLLARISDMQSHELEEDVHSIKVAVYRYGREAVLQSLYIMSSDKNDFDFNTLKPLVDFVKGWDIPAFPLSGEDLKEKGVPEGPELGKKLKQAEDKWLESEFVLTKESLIKIVTELIEK